VVSLGPSSTSDVIPLDQIWYHLHSTGAGGKHLSNDDQIRVISRMEPEICSIMLKTLSEKLRAKFPATTPWRSIVKFARLDGALLKVFFTTSKPSRRPITAAQRKEKEKKERRKKNYQKAKSPRTLVTFSSKTQSNLISAHAQARMS